MNVADLLKPDRVGVGVRLADKTQLLQELGRRAGAATGLAPDAIASALAARERLGSTGLGRGFALPHARIEGLAALIGVLLRLAKPIDFGAIDGQPVDLVFLLLEPVEAAAAHLAALSAVSRQMRDPGFALRARRAETAAALYELMVAVPGAPPTPPATAGLGSGPAA